MTLYICKSKKKEAKMGVNWQNNDYYRGLKDYERETGLSVADRNRLANPYGNHSFGGLLISQLLPQLLVGGAEKLGAKLEGSGDTGSATDVKSSTNLQTEIAQNITKFKAALDGGDTKSAKLYLKNLKYIAQENDSNNAKDAYKVAKDSFKKAKKD